MLQQSILIACVGLSVLGCSNESTLEEHETGAGTITLDLGAGHDSFWSDTDGVDPEVAGCHIELADSSCNVAAAAPRNFGEYCQEDGTLIESNPGAHVCHTHENDIGHPYVVDCDGWCRGTFVLPNNQRRGIAAAGGECVVVHELPCDQGVVDSAKCVCH